MLAHCGGKPRGQIVFHDRPVGGEAEEGVGAVQDFSCAGMEVHGEGEHDAQRQGSQALSAVCGEHWAGAEAHVGHGHHLRCDEESKSRLIVGDCVKRKPFDLAAVRKGNN